MPLKTLIVIALRLYAIYWLVEGLAELLIYVPTAWSPFANMACTLLPEALECLSFLSLF